MALSLLHAKIQKNDWPSPQNNCPPQIVPFSPPPPLWAALLVITFFPPLQWTCCHGYPFFGSLGASRIPFRCYTCCHSPLYSKFIFLKSKCLQRRICRSSSRLSVPAKMLFKRILTKLAGQDILKAMVQQELNHIFQ
jgi:hypothetical protein